MELFRDYSKDLDTSSDDEDIYVEAGDWETQIRMLNVPKTDICDAKAEQDEQPFSPPAILDEQVSVVEEEQSDVVPPPEESPSIPQIDAEAPHQEDEEQVLLSELDAEDAQNDQLLQDEDDEAMPLDTRPKESFPNLVLTSEEMSSPPLELNIPRFSLSDEITHSNSESSAAERIASSPLQQSSALSSRSEPISPLENAQYDESMENVYTDNVLTESLQSPSEFLQQRSLSILSRLTTDLTEESGVEFLVLEQNQLESSSIIPVQEAATESESTEPSVVAAVSSQHHYLIDKEIHPSEILYLSQVRTRPSYLPEHLRNEKEFLTRRSNQEIPRDVFFFLLQEYLKSCEEVALAIAQGENLWRQRRTLSAKAYKKERIKIRSERIFCADDVRVRHVETQHKFTLDDDILRRLSTTQQEHRNLFYNYINARKLHSSFNREKVKSHLDCLFRERPFFTLHTDFVQSPLSPTLEQNHNLNSLKNKIATLFYFESLCASKTASAILFAQIQQFRDDCRSWIKQCISHLIAFTNVDDQRFILVELMKCRNIGQWGPELLYVSELHTDDDVNTFLACLSLFLLTPFHFKDKPGKFILTESDFEHLFNQFHFPNLIQYLVENCSHVGSFSRFDTWRSAFQVVDLVVFILSKSLRHFASPKYNAFSRKIAQTITSLHQVLRSQLEAKNLLSIREVSVGMCKLFVKCYMAILESAQNGGSMRTLPFLAALPMSSSPRVISFSVFLSCFVGDNLLSLSEVDIAHMFSSLDEWKQFASTRRVTFHKMLNSTENSVNCSAFVAAFSQMGIQSPLLAQIIAIELFHLMYLNPTCEEFVFKEALEALYDLCCCHPESVISLLVEQIFLNHQTTQYDSFKLLRRIPLVLWNPSIREINLVMISLQSTVGELEFNFAKYILSHLYYPELSSNASKHLLIQIVECLQSQYSRGLKFFFKKSSLVQKEKQFHAWVVDVLVRIVFCTVDGASVFEPLSPDAPILKTIVECMDDSRYSTIAPLLAFVLMLVTTAGYHLDDFHTFACDRSPTGWMRKLHSRPDEIYARCVVDTSLRLFSSVPQSSDRTLFPLLVETLITSGSQKQWDQLSPYLSRIIINRFDTLVHDNMKQKAEDFIIFWMQELLSDKRSLKCDATLNLLNSLCKACLRNKLYSRLLLYLTKYHLDAVESFALDDRKWSDLILLGFPSNLFRSNKKVFQKIIKPQCTHPFVSLMLLMSDSQHLSKQRAQMGDTLVQKRTNPDVMLHNTGHKHAIFKVLAHCLALGDILVNRDSSRFYSPLIKREDIDSTLLGFWKLFFDLFFENSAHPSGQVFFGYLFLLVSHCADEFFSAIETGLKNIATHYGRVSKEKIEKEKENARMFASYAQCYTSMGKWIAPFKGKVVPNVTQFCASHGSYSVTKIVSCLGEKCFEHDLNGLWYDLMCINQPPARDSRLLRKIYPSEFITFPLLNRERTLSSADHLVLSNPLPKPVPQYNNSVFFFRNRADILGRNEQMIAKQIIDDVIREFFQSRERHNALDAHCVKNLLPHLYYSRQFKRTVEVKCNKKCTGPAKVTVAVEEFHVNEVVQNDLEVNTTSVQQLLDREYITVPFSQELLKLEACTEELMRVCQFMSFEDGAEISSKGMNWFWFLCDIVEAAHNIFPALEARVEVMMNQIFKGYVEHSVDAADMILQRMLRNPRSIPSLVAYFNPQVCLDRWDNLLQSILEKRLPVDMLLPLLRRFRIHAFVAEENHYARNVQYTSRICNCLVDGIVALYTSGVGPHAQIELMSLYLEWLRVIMPLNVAHHYRLVVRNVIDHVAFERIPTALLTLLTDPTIFGGKIDVSIMRFCGSVTSSRLMLLRNDRSLYARMQSKSLASLRTFFCQMFGLLPAEALTAVDAPSALFETAVEMFGPFILEGVDIQRQCIVLPTSSPTQHPEFELFVMAFVELIQYLCAYSSYSVLGDVLLLYINRLWRLPEKFLGIYHTKLTSLDWEHALMSDLTINNVLTFFGANLNKTTHYFLLNVLRSAACVNNDDIPNRRDVFPERRCVIM